MVIIKIKSIRKVKLNNPIKLYDVVNATPNNNFLVKTNSNYIVSHNCGFLDEMDFTSGSSQIEGQSKIVSLYVTIKRRIESRYMKQGRVPGIMFLVSSKKSSSDFLESYIQSNLDNDKLLISDEPIWNVKNTNGRYSGNKFKLMVGDRVTPSKILPDDISDEEILEYEDAGFRVIDVPVEHREAFELSVNDALRDIAGIALSSNIKFIDMKKYENSIKGYLSNPFTSNIIELDFDDKSELANYLIPNRLIDSEKSLPHSIHWDTSKNGDRTGLSMVCAIGIKNTTKLNKITTYKEYDRMYKVTFSVGITPTKGKEIPFFKIRNFIYYLKYTLGYNIVSISCDSYQSLDTLQQFKLKGLPSKVISMDRSIDPYNNLKNTINEGRLMQPRIEELEEEYSDVYYDSARNKVDHTVTGSKDMLDSVGGALYGLTLVSEIEMTDVSEDNNVMLEINKGLNSNRDNAIDTGWLLDDGYKYYD